MEARVETLTDERDLLQVSSISGSFNNLFEVLSATVPRAGGRASGVTTKGPMWGYPRGRFWDLGTVLEPFCGKLLPKVDKPVKN